MEKHVALCPNPYRDTELRSTMAAVDILNAAGIPWVISPVFKTSAPYPLDNINAVPLDQAVENACLVVSFGGDGTILQTAHAAMKGSVPLIGVNLGTKGFMAELDSDELYMLPQASRGDYLPSTRMMLDVKLVRGGEVIYSDSALNDAVVSGVAHAVGISAKSDGQVITEYSGDGMIAATPTGSTAYSMSAGGPLVEPTAKNIILTPICPHILAARSFVLAPDRLVTLRADALKGRRAVLSVDGLEPVDLLEGDEVCISRSEYVTTLAHVNSKSFYDIVYEKLSERK